MTARNAVAILNELLGAEQKSVARRLLESTVFVSADAVSDEPMAHRLAAMSHEHEAWLAQAISDLGGEPSPRVLDVLSADLHFQGLAYAMHRLREDLERLIGMYEAATERLNDHPHALALAGKILNRHRREFDEIKEHPSDQVLDAG